MQLLGADLLHHSEVIRLVPILDDAAIGDAVDRDATVGHVVPGRRRPEEFPGVDAPHRPPRHDLVALCHLIVDAELDVRYAASKHRERVEDLLASADAMEDGVWCDQL